MEVPKALLDKWKVLYTPGDAKKISESMPEDIRVNDETIRRAFAYGECNEDVFKAIGDFYTARAELIKQYL